MRFALYEAKVGLAEVLFKYRFVKTSNTPEKVTLDPQSALSNCVEPLLVKIEKR